MREGQPQALISLGLDEGHWQTMLWSKVTVGKHGTAYAQTIPRVCLTEQQLSQPVGSLLRNVKVRGGEREMITINTAHVH